MENNRNNLPPQGGRIPRGRRGKGIVPARSPSSSDEGLDEIAHSEVRILEKVEDAVSMYESSCENDEDDAADGKSILSSDIDSKRVFRRGGEEHPIDALGRINGNIHAHLLFAPSDIKGKARENHMRKWAENSMEFSTGLINRIRSMQEKILALNEDNIKLRGRVECLESDVKDVKQFLQLSQERASDLTDKKCKIIHNSQKHVNSGNECAPKNNEDMCEMLVNRVDVFLGEFINKIHPLIEVEVRKVCNEKLVTSKSYADKLKEVSRDESTNYTREMKDVRSLSDPAIDRDLNRLNRQINSDKFFPPLSGRKKNQDSIVNKIPKSRGNDNVGSVVLAKGNSNGKSNTNENTNRVAMRKQSREEALIINIDDEKQVTYNNLLIEFKKTIDLQKDVGIQFLKVQKTRNGRLILAINSQDAYAKIKLLKECIETITSKYGGNVTVTCSRRKMMNLILNGVNEFVSIEEISTAIVSTVNCNIEEFSLGKINYKSYGRWSIRVVCPVTIGEAVMRAGRMRIGWNWATVRLVAPPAIRCYRCLRTGHTREQCTEVDDRSLRCFKCGSSDHKAVSCDNVKLSCPLCSDENRNANHHLGSPECVSLSFPRQENVKRLNLNAKLNNIRLPSVSPEIERGLTSER